MSIVKTSRKLGRAAGKVLDPEDRQFAGQVLIIFGGVSAVIIGGAGVIGAAIRVFTLAMG